MSNSINLEEFTDEFGEHVDKEVHEAVENGKSTISTEGKPIEILRFQQKIAEFKRLYYQWYYSLGISAPGINI